MNLIQSLSGFSQGYKFNPLVLIKVVNFFHDLGYEKSLEALYLYCETIEQLEGRLPNIAANALEVIKETDKVFMVARLLFVCKDQKNILPKLWLGQPDIEPKELSLFPWFPLHIERNIPFLLLMRGYTLFGVSQSPRSYLDWCRKECQLRKTPLLPTNNPLILVDELINSEFYKNVIMIGAEKEAIFFLEKAFCRMLKLQALRMVDNIYLLSEQDEIKFFFGSNSTEEEIDKIWQNHRQAIAKLNILWNPVKNEYEQKYKH